MNWLSDLRSLEFTSSFMFLAAFLFLAALIAWNMYGPRLMGGKRTSTGDAPIASAKESVIPEDRIARTAKAIKFVALLVLSGLIAAMITVPGSVRSEITTAQESVFEQSTGLIVFDISGSVRGPILEAGQDFLTYFLEHQKENMQDSSRIGISFYSAFNNSNLFMYRTPTSDFESLAHDVGRISMARSRNPALGESLFVSLSGGTNTVGALYEAARKLKDMEQRNEDLEGLSIILIVDVHSEAGRNLQRTIEGIAEAVEDITSVGINVYIASITPTRRAEEVISTFNRLIGTNPRFEIFDILGAESSEELDAIAAAISAMETRRFTSTEVHISSAETEISREFAIIVLLVIIAFILLSELFARRARGCSIIFPQKKDSAITLDKGEGQ